ncbi:MAG: DPP IV N-terminal domain-containing protein, partial [Halobacteriales archaeon]|nr:DPP IV N-terminal domain-containing protein [Halobacteriales archaeon]
MRTLRPDRRRILAPALGLLLLTPVTGRTEPAPSQRELVFRQYLELPERLRGGVIKPHWMPDGSSLWYAEELSGETRFYRVDPTSDPIVSRIPRPPRDDERSTDRLSPARPGEIPSPDGRLFASVADHNLLLRAASQSDPVRITDDGELDDEWVVARDAWVKGFWSGTGAMWSPDSRRLALKRVDGREVEDLPYIRFLTPETPLGWNRFPRPGDPTFQTELWVIDVVSGERVRLDAGQAPDQRLEILGWREATDEILFVRLNRRHTKLELLAGSATTGASRVLLTEERDTYVVGAGHGFEQDLLTPLADGERFIWRSDRDGFRHFYLYDFEGTLIRRLTRGEFPVLGIEALDESWLYFTGRSAERPYDKYLYRVGLDGVGLTRLTDAPGSHQIEFSPSGKYFLDTHSSLDRPPAVDLRRADGSLVETLSRARLEDLGDLPWAPPEEFVVKALDGKTDLYGVVFKPWDFDPSRKYPVVEYIYNGPQDSLRAFGSPFTAHRVLRAISQLGFVVFIADGPGTPERGRAFHEAAFGQYGLFEIPEHVEILKKLAKSRPYFDLDRVGIVGHSHGGYLALRAMLTEPDVYRVGISMS